MNNVQRKIALAIVSLAVVLLVIGVIRALSPKAHYMPAGPAGQAAWRASCANNLKQWGLVFKMYANEARGGQFPPAGYLSGDFVNGFPYAFMSSNLNYYVLYPEYLTDMNVSFCPSSITTDSARDAIDALQDGKTSTMNINEDQQIAWGGATTQHIADLQQFNFSWAAVGASYQYAPWVAISASDWFGRIKGIDSCGEYGSSIECLNTDLTWYPDGPTWIEEFGADIQNGFPEAWPPTGSGNRAVPSGSTGTTYRLREGIERFLITDINNPAGSAASQSNVPVLWDTLAAGLEGVLDMAYRNMVSYNHIPGGCNVLFMDGHVAFMKYNGNPDATGFPIIRFTAQFTGNMFTPGQRLDFSIN